MKMQSFNHLSDMITVPLTKTLTSEMQMMSVLLNCCWVMTNL